ncbi:MAG: hypothetical protein R3C53_22685 [Pirellulaceae bacterium]
MTAKFLRGMAGLALASLTLLSSAHAAIIVTVSDVDIEVGGTAFMDFFVESDVVAGETYANSLYDFLITPVVPTVTQLAFVVPQPASYVTEPDYLFFNDSFGPAGSVFTTTTPGDSFSGGDSTSGVLFAGDTPYATPLTSTKRLLVRVQLTTATGLPAGVGDAFDVTLNSNTLFSSLSDENFNPLAFNLANSDFVGRVNVIAATAVPEPSSLALCTFLSLAGVGFRSRRRS